MLAAAILLVLQETRPAALAAWREELAALLPAAVDRPLEFADAAARRLRGEGGGTVERAEIARYLLDLSPAEAPRIFTDSRAVTGWDLAYQIALEAGGTAAAPLRAAHQLLLPSAWKVADAAAVLAGALRDRNIAFPDPALAAAVIYQFAERCGGYDKYRPAAAEIVQLGRERLGADAAARHALAIAAIRMHQFSNTRIDASARAEHAKWWEEAASSAPAARARELLMLAAMRDAFLRGDKASKSDAAAAAARLAASAEYSAEARRRAGELRIRMFISAEFFDGALAVAEAAALLDRGAPRDAASLLAAAADAAFTYRKQSPELLLMLSDALRKALAAARGAPEEAAAALALARTEMANGEFNKNLLELAARQALDGKAPDPPPPSPLPPPWQLLDPPAAEAAPAWKASRTAAWILAHDHLKNQAWEAALQYLQVKPPGDACGNVTEEEECERRLGVAKCYERLARGGEARAELRDAFLKFESRACASRAAVELVNYELRGAAAAALRAWLTAQASTERVLKAFAFLDLREARETQQSARAAAAAARIAEKWPDDPVLLEAAKAR